METAAGNAAAMGSATAAVPAAARTAAQAAAKAKESARKKLQKFKKEKAVGLQDFKISPYCSRENLLWVTCALILARTSSSVARE